MANFAYTKAKADLLKGLIDFTSDDIRMLLVMTNTTADDEEDLATFGDIAGALDEFDGSGYSSPGVALTTEAVSQDDTNDRGEFSSDNVAFGALGAGTRQIQAAILYKFVTNLAGSQPIAYIDTGGFPLTANGATVTVNVNAQGWLQLT